MSDCDSVFGHICDLEADSNNMVMKLAYGPVHHGYIKITSKGMDVDALVKVTERGF